MSRRALLPVLLVSALAAPLTVASAAPKLPVLTGTVRVTASYSAVMDVRLPKAVTVGDGWIAPKGTVVSGKGRIVGAMLLNANVALPAMEAVQFGFCPTVGCTPVQPRLFFKADDDDDAATDTSEVLPAGDYRLLIITDGAPVTVTLKLPGLPGSATFKPQRRVLAKHMQVEMLTSAASTPFHPVYVGSVSTEIDGGQGIMLHSLQVANDQSASQEETFCLYDGSALAPEPAPACPGGRSTHIGRNNVQTELRYWRMFGRYRYLQPGAFRAGPYYTSIGTAHDPLATVTWVTLPPR